MKDVRLHKKGAEVLSDSCLPHLRFCCSCCFLLWFVFGENHFIYSEIFQKKYFWVGSCQNSEVERVMQLCRSEIFNTRKVRGRGGGSMERDIGISVARSCQLPVGSPSRVLFPLPSQHFSDNVYTDRIKACKAKILSIFQIIYSCCPNSSVPPPSTRELLFFSCWWCDKENGVFENLVVSCKDTLGCFSAWFSVNSSQKFGMFLDSA